MIFLKKKKKKKKMENCRKFSQILGVKAGNLKRKKLYERFGKFLRELLKNGGNNMKNL